MKRVEIQLALGLRHEDHFRDTYLMPGLQAGFIEMTIPEKPKSSRQKYRLTTRGLSLKEFLHIEKHGFRRLTKIDFLK